MADTDARVLGDAEGPHRGRDDGTLPQAWTLPFTPALCRNHACCGTDRHLRAREGSRARASPLPSASADRRLTRSLPFDSQEPTPARLSAHAVRAALKVRLARDSRQMLASPTRRSLPLFLAP